jgi:hypothetical protein
MKRVVTYMHRYKRPPRKRAKTAAIEAPAVVQAAAKGGALGRWASSARVRGLAHAAPA